MPSNPARLNTEQDTVAPVLAEPLRVRRVRGATDSRRRKPPAAFARERVFLFRVTACGLALSTLLAFLIPFRYEARTQIMPPDQEFGSGLASLLTMTGQAGGSSGSLGMLAGDFLGLKTSGSLFIGILRSRTVEDRIIDKFDLRSVYGVKLMENARRQLEENTQIGRRSQERDHHASP